MSARNGTLKSKSRFSTPATSPEVIQRKATDKPIDKVARYKWSMVDSPGTFEMIPKDELEVDLDYQREGTAQKIRNITAEWSWLACGVLLVARRPDGRKFVYDGGHRTHAARNRSDIRELPCLVFDTEDIAEEAMGFLRANTFRKPVNAVDKFRAQLMTGDPTALLVDRLIREHGLRVKHQSNAAKTVACLGRLMGIAKGQPEVLIQVWPLLVELTQDAAMHERVLESIVYVQSKLMAKGESLMFRPWITRVRKLGREGVLEAANKAAAYYAHGGTAIWGKGLVQAINRGAVRKLELSIVEEAE
jgi:hypothetical protein